MPAICHVEQTGVKCCKLARVSPESGRRAFTDDGTADGRRPTDGFREAPAYIPPLECSGLSRDWCNCSTVQMRMTDDTLKDGNDAGIFTVWLSLPSNLARTERRFPFWPCCKYHRNEILSSLQRFVRSGFANSLYYNQGCQSIIIFFYQN